MKQPQPWYSFYFHIHVYYTKIEDLLITLYFYVCRWNKKRCNIKLNLINKTFQITQVQYNVQVMKIWDVQVAWAMTVVRMMNDDHRNWMSQVVYLGIFVCENQTCCLTWIYYPNGWRHVTNSYNNYLLTF